jgi:DNA-binding beta-propeller fold protein YncE
VGADLKEIDARTGSIVRVISLGAPESVLLTALAVSGKYLLVGGAGRESGGSGTVGELDLATSRTLKVINGKLDHFGVPLSMAVNGSDLFVVSLSQDSAGNNVWELSEVRVPGGQLVRTFSNAAYHINNPGSVFSYGHYVFVISQGSSQLTGSDGPSSITQIDARTGALVRTIHGPLYELKGAVAMAGLNGDLYVADAGANAVTVIDPNTGEPLEVLRGTRYGFAHPDGLATWGAHLYVVNGEGETVTDIEFAS